MRAILLSAGFGKRLMPITSNTPKCLAKVGGKPLLQIWFEQLTCYGVNEILVNTHYLHEQVEAFVRESPFAKKVRLVFEPELRGTARTVSDALGFWQEDEMFIAHADNLCICDFPRFFDAFRERDAGVIGTMMLFKSADPKSCGVVKLNEKGRVTEFYEKVNNPPSNLANAAVYIFSREAKIIFSGLSEGEFDISQHVIPKMIGRLNTWVNDEYMRDLGTVENLNRANKDVFKGAVLI